jgi:spermidine/putrescine transport system substrate-binding protein
VSPARLAIVGLCLGLASTARAEGVLNIFNWGDYTSPELIAKFEQAYGVDVTITDFDSNDTALAKVKAGGHGFDIVVPSASFMSIWIGDGLLLETRPDQMENFGHVEPRWVDVPFDPGRHYSVPWQWGVTTIAANTDAYKGPLDSWSVVFDPPPELAGKIFVVPEMSDVVGAAILYVGGEPCTGDKAVLRRARDVLAAARPAWLSLDYGAFDGFAKGDFLAALAYNGGFFRARLENPAIRTGFPKEGFPIWMDNVAVLADANNVENAKLFQNFVMDPQNAAMISAYARYANGIAGSEAYLPEDMRDAPELTLPQGHKGVFIQACPPEVNEMMTRIWTDLQK